MKTCVINMFNLKIRHLQRLMMFFVFLTFTVSAFAENNNWEGKASVTVKKTGNGTIYIDDTKTETAQKYIDQDNESATFKLKAAPDENNVFLGWSDSENGEISNTDNPREVTLNGAEDNREPSATYYAKFVSTNITLKCDQIGYTFAKLSWNAIDNADSYDLYDGSTLIGRYTTPSATIETLNYGSTHKYTVKSVIGSTISNPSNTVEITTTSYPQVQNVHFSNVKQNQVTVNWNPVTISPANHSLVRYHVHFYKIAATAEGTFIKAITTTETSYTFDGLTDNTQYTAYVDVEYQYTLNGETKNVHESRWSSAAVTTASFIPTTAFDGVQIYKGEWHRVMVNSTKNITDATYTFPLNYPCENLSYEAWLSGSANISHTISVDATGESVNLADQDWQSNNRYTSTKTIKTNTKQIIFTGNQGATGNKTIYLDNIYAKITPHISFNIPATNNLGQVEIGSTAKLDIDFKSFLTKGNLVVTTNDNQFLIDGTLESKTLTTGSNVLEKIDENNHNFNVVFAPKSIGTHTATITITDGTSTETITITGECTKKTPTITWVANKQLVYGTNLTNAASSDCGTAITYTSDNEEIIDIVNNELVPVGIGFANITATTTGNDTYKSVSLTTQFEVTNKTLQEVIWEQNFYLLKLGDTDITLNAYSINKETKEKNNLLIEYSVGNTNIITIINNDGVLQLHIVGKGQTTITAHQQGNGEYAGAYMTKTVIVREVSDDCSSNYALVDGGQTWDKGGFNWDAVSRPCKLSTVGEYLTFTTTKTSGLLPTTGGKITVTDEHGVQFHSGDLGTTETVKINRNTKNLTFTLEGNRTIGISEILVTPAIYLESQSEKITFPSTEAGKIGTTQVAIDWANQPDMMIAYITDDNAGVFSVDQNTAIFGGSCGDYGTSTVKLNFKPTTPGSYTANLIVSVGVTAKTTITIPITATAIKTPQFITWTQDLTALNPTQGNSYDLSASASSGLAVTFSSSNENVARIECGKLVVVGAGSATITATQAGNENFEAATPIEKSISVAKLNQSITWNQEFNQYLTVGETYQLAATASSGLDVTYTSSDENVAHISGNNVIIRAVGNATISAIQNGNANYNAASVITKTITAKNVKITENELPSKYYETETYGSITRTITRSHTELADWLWISSPFDATVSVKFGDIEIPLTWKGNPAPEACYLLKEYDAAARATGANKPWVDVQTSAGNPTIYAGKGYILGVDPRSYEGDFTITFTSVNSENASNNQGYSTEINNYTSEYPTLANNHVVGTGLFETPSGLDFSNNEYSTVFFAVRADAGSESYYNYYDNDFSVLSPYKSFFMQYGGEYTFKTSAARQNAPAVIANNNTTERYQLNINSDNYNDKTVIFMAENGTEGYTAGQDFFYMTKTADGGTIGYQFYSIDGEEPLSYNHRKNENQVIQLGGRVKKAGEYTISLEGENINAQSVMLVDTLTGETVDLLIDNYTFTTEKGSIDKRFILTFTFAPQTTVDIFTPTANQIIVFGNAQNCTIDNLVIGETIMIFDAMGRMIYNKTANSETINIALPTGTYIVRNANNWAKFAIK